MTDKEFDKLFHIEGTEKELERTIKRLSGKTVEELSKGEQLPW